MRDGPAFSSDERRAARRSSSASLAGCFLLLLAACGGGGGGSSAGGPPATYSIGGALSGLAAGAILTLRNNGGDDLAIGANGPFAFASELASGGAYHVTILAQPAGQRCTVENGSGTVTAAKVTNVRVTCADTAGGLPAPVVTLGFGIKQVKLSWAVVPGAAHYRVLEDPTGSAGFTQLGGDLTATSYDVDVFLPGRASARYAVDACVGAGCTRSGPVEVAPLLAQAIGYFKASNTGANDRFGNTVALSDDGSTLAVGAWGESSDATGVGGAQGNDLAPYSGAVYIYVRSGGTWIEQAYVKASNAGIDDQFGRASIALSGDGDILAVGVPSEDSDGTPSNNALSNSGAVYVFTRSGDAWTEQAYLKDPSVQAGDAFGKSVALSADGSTLAVGDSYAGASTSGGVHVFANGGPAWTHEAYLQAANANPGSSLGGSLALSSDGGTLAVGSVGDTSNATGIDGDPTNNSLSYAGAVHVFTRSGATWAQQAYVKASNTDAFDFFGCAVALSADGNSLAVGAYGEDSNATGIGGVQSDNSATGVGPMTGAGAVYVFTRAASTWTQQAYVKASNTGAADRFGWSVALSGDGAVLAVGAEGEASSATGLDGAQHDDSAFESGAIYTFTRKGTTWAQQAYVKAPYGGSNGSGSALALSGDGKTMAVGAPYEDSGATGVGGDPGGSVASDSGAVYLY